MNETFKDFKIVVNFDRVCKFCDSWVNFIIKRDKKNLFYFSHLQSNYAKKI